MARTQMWSASHDPAALSFESKQNKNPEKLLTPFPSKNSKRDKLVANADGSVDLYFGPKPPAGKEANWIASVPNKGFFAIFRLYGPLEPWFDKTWRPGEIEEVK